MKENFPNLAKEIDIQVQESQRIPKKLDAKRATSRPIIIKMPTVKDKKRILKVAREESYKGVPYELISQRNVAGKKGLARSVRSDEKQGPTSKITLSSKAITRVEVQIKLPRQGKTRGVHHHQALIT